MKTSLITNIAFGGEGIARHEGKVVFIPFVLPSELVEFDIVEHKKSFSRGKLINILKSSPERVIPKCEYYGRCGGCQLQHASYPLQLQIKQQFVQEALTRIAKISESKIQPIIGTSKQWGYRRRIRLKEQNQQFGFVGVDGHTFVPITQCEISSGKDLQLDPDIFIQAHHEQSEKLYQDITSEILKLEKPAILDLYCGTGTLTSELASLGCSITAIEINPKAITYAQQNHPNLNIKWLCADVAEVIHKYLKQKPEIVLVNPPRSGLSPKTCRALAQHKPKHIFYTSCMPSTLARDLKILCESGYQIQFCQPYDLFPQTTHVETVVHLSFIPCIS